MKWIKASERLAENLKPIKIRFDGEEHSSKWDEKEKAFMVVGIRFPPTMYFIEWLDEESPVPDKANEIALEAMDFYWRELTDKLNGKDLGDIERRNYEVLSAQLYKIISNPAKWQAQQSDAVELIKWDVTFAYSGSGSREFLTKEFELRKGESIDKKIEKYLYEQNKGEAKSDRIRYVSKKKAI